LGGFVAHAIEAGAGDVAADKRALDFRDSVLIRFTMA
jgi:hypothetical protein